MAAKMLRISNGSIEVTWSCSVFVLVRQQWGCCEAEGQQDAGGWTDKPPTAHLKHT